MNETENKNEVMKDMVKIVLKCGRNMEPEFFSNNDNDWCGSWETATSNQTMATCC